MTYEDGLSARHQAKYANQLPTAEDQAAYAAKTVAALVDSAYVLLELAQALRANPGAILSDAFAPDIQGMPIQAGTVMEVTYFPTVMPKVEVRSRTKVGDTDKEVAFRIMKFNGAIHVGRDDRTAT